MVDADLVGLSFRYATYANGALLIAAALLVGRASRRLTAGRALSGFLLVTALALLALVSPVTLALNPLPASALPTDSALFSWFLTMSFAAPLFLVAFVALFPSRVRLVTPAGILWAIGGAVFLARLGSWLFFRDAWYVLAEGNVLRGWAPRLSDHVEIFGPLLLAASILLRLRGEVPATRHGAGAIAIALALSPMAHALAGPTAVALGSAPSDVVALYTLPPPDGDSWRVLPALTLLGYGASVASLVVVARVVGAKAVGAIVVFGIAVAGVITTIRTDFYYPPLLAAGILPVYAISRYPALGADPPAPWSRGGFALLALAACVLSTVGTTVAATGIEILSLVFGLTIGIAAGVAVAVSLIPTLRMAIGTDGTTQLPPGGTLPIGIEPRTASRYRSKHALGEGGGGVTRLCRDEKLDRDVVLKSIRAGDVGLVMREARALARLHHPHVIGIYDVLDEGQEALLVMEYAQGGSLKDRLRQGPLSASEFLILAHGLLDALDAVHAVGLVHRDVKPSNVLYTSSGVPKLADFGIARASGAETTLGALGLPARGTPRYMSPEQARGRPAGAPSDLYSAALTLYEAHTGAAYVAIMEGESAAEVQMRAAAPGAFQRAVGPPPLRAWFARALAYEPGDRFESARAMQAGLDAALS